MQVTVEDRAMIFNLTEYDEEAHNFVAIRDYAYMKQLIDPELYVYSEYNIQDCYSLPKLRSPKINVCKQIIINRSRDFFLSIKRSQKSLRVNEGDKIKLPRVRDGAYKTYDEGDF